MSETINEFAALMERLRGGDQEAAREVYERYGEAVRRVVRRRLEVRMRRQYDSEDFSQCVWSSFFAVPSSDQLFQTPDALISYLSRMAVNKVIESKRRQLGTQRRGGGNDRSLDSEIAVGSQGALTLGQTLADTLPTSSEIVRADELKEDLLDKVPPGHRRIFELLQEGYTQVEIAERLNIDRRVIYRIVERLKEFIRPA
jgi:RNA polymerase sigma-70 factor (ECF subfamily)